MNKLVIAFTIILMASNAQAQSHRRLKDIDRELKQSTSTETTAALIESIGEATPETEEDVVSLGQLMDKYPTQGQKALAGIKDPKLAKAVQIECGRKISRFKADKNVDWSKLPTQERLEKLNSYLASQAMMVTLGNLRNKDSLPFLKQYITAEYDGTLSYIASRAIGVIAPNDPAVFQELWNKTDVKSISYNAYGKSVLKEVAQKLQSPGVSKVEKDKLRSKANVELLNGSDSEEKQLLKEIVLNHPDWELRKQAGLAMVKALMFHPSDGDVDFVLQWTKDPKNDSGPLAMTYMRDHYDRRFIPVVLNYLKDGDVYARSKAIELVRLHKTKESLPYLKECIINDNDAEVRSGCRETYWEITGEMSSEFNSEDAAEMEKYLNDPEMILFHSQLDNDDPMKKQYLAQKAALLKYKASQKM